MTREQIKQKILESGAIPKKRYAEYHNGEDENATKEERQNWKAMNFSYNLAINTINIEKLIDIIEEAYRQRPKDSTDNCFLVYGDENRLVCTYNHESGENCLVRKCEFCHHYECICYK